VSVELWVSGPVIDITLHGADPSAPTETLEGIVDTGASVICLDRRVAIRLGLKAVNRKMMEVADGSQVEATIYMAEMAIEGLGFKKWVEVFALPMTSPSRRVLLGRSFLKNYHVTYSGPDELFHYFDATHSVMRSFEDLDG
jgi:predicted aspartyl protease